MDQGGQGGQLEGGAGEPKLLCQGCPLLHGRNGFQACLGRSGESPHEEQEEIWWLEMTKSGQGNRERILSLLLCIAASMAHNVSLQKASFCFKKSSRPFPQPSVEPKESSSRGPWELLQLKTHHRLQGGSPR